MAAQPPRPPAQPSLPRQPDELRGGLCRSHGEPGWWSSNRPSLREAAVHVCHSCPALQPCAAWSLALPGSDKAIYGGLSSADRQRLAAKRQRAA